LSNPEGNTENRAILVTGGRQLSGEVAASGAKNSALPLICASVLADGPVTLTNVPRLDDVLSICELLESLGAKCAFDGGSLTIDPTSITRQDAPYELVRRMRASFLVLGPLLAKFGHAEVPLPGGCNIGPRPVDEHLRALGEMGAEIEFKKGVVYAGAKKLRGEQVYFNITSVGATENVVMAAMGAEGVTVLENCAEEPEVADLVNFLRSLGADIKTPGSKRLEVRGGLALKQREPYSIIPDRIEAGTFLLAVAATGGGGTVKRCEPAHLTALTEKLREMGVGLRAEGNDITLAPNGRLKATKVRTQPYPGFPTDLQPQITTVLTMAQGVSVVTESVFEQRFSYLPELKRMGANIIQQDNAAIVDGTGVRLTGAPVDGYDLRGVAAMTIAGLMAQGETLIRGFGHLVRGYEDFIAKMEGLGADIRLVDKDYELKNNHG
jgi:UDP-N-acetylglucosamine 1-carboxyvinyltransferase